MPHSAAPHCVGGSSPLRDSTAQMTKQPHQSVPQLIKRPGCVPSCLCDWCTLKNMNGPLEYAQPPYFYLPDMSVWVCEMNKCVALKADRGTHCPNMRWQTCILPRDLIWEEMAPPQYKGMKRKELGLSKNELVTVHEKQYQSKVPHCSITKVL